MNYDRANSYNELKSFYGSEIGSGMVHYFEQQEKLNQSGQLETINIAVIMCMLAKDKTSIKYTSIEVDGQDYVDFDINYIQTNISKQCINSIDAESILTGIVEKLVETISISNNKAYTAFSEITATQTEQEVLFDKTYREIAISNKSVNERIYVRLNSPGNVPIELGRVGEVDSSISFEIDVNKVYYFTSNNTALFSIILAG